MFSIFHIFFRSLFWGLPVKAEPTPSLSDEYQKQTHQYVFLFDDSGSMNDNDPNRLSLFAVRSLMMMLKDDEITILRLNDPVNFNDQGSLPEIEPVGTKGTRKKHL